MMKLRFLDLHWLLESRERSRNLPLSCWLLQGGLPWQGIGAMWRLPRA